MVVVVGKPETAESVRELNFRGEFEVCEIAERSISAIQRQLEQQGEQISHLVYDVRIIGNIDQSLGLLERICVTVPGIKTIVVTEGLSTDSAFMRDILTLVPAEQIVSDHGAELKRVLNTMLCDAGLISEDTVQNDTPSLEEPTPPGETAQAPPASTSEVVIPPSQIDRETARSHLVLPKPRLRGRNATTIAVCGAGHRIGNESVKRTFLASVNLMETRLNNRTNKVLSELAIQQAIICQVLAHELEINPRALDNYRRAAVEYLKMNDRVFRLEDILEE